MFDHDPSTLNFSTYQFINGSLTIVSEPPEGRGRGGGGQEFCPVRFCSASPLDKYTAVLRSIPWLWLAYASSWGGVCNVAIDVDFCLTYCLRSLLLAPPAAYELANGRRHRRHGPRYQSRWGGREGEVRPLPDRNTARWRRADCPVQLPPGQELWRAVYSPHRGDQSKRRASSFSMLRNVRCAV